VAPEPGGGEVKGLTRLGAIAVPAVFALSGAGMLLLLSVERAPGTFFDQVAQREGNWIAAHVLLLAGTILIPAATLALRSAVTARGPARLATAAVLAAVPTSFLLAGQYAIDFVVPLIGRVGGDALQVHALLFDSAPVSVMFYGLPNLVFPALLLLAVALVWGRVVTGAAAVLLLGNWIVVLTGNLAAPEVQRAGILLLAVTHLPAVTAVLRREAVPDRGPR